MLLLAGNYFAATLWKFPFVRTPSYRLAYYGSNLQVSTAGR